MALQSSLVYFQKYFSLLMKPLRILFFIFCIQNQCPSAILLPSKCSYSKSSKSSCTELWKAHLIPELPTDTVFRDNMKNSVTVMEFQRLKRRRVGGDWLSVHSSRWIRERERVHISSTVSLSKHMKTAFIISAQCVKDFHLKGSNSLHLIYL